VGAIVNLPCFILLDLNMPRKDGREALNEIKAHNIFKKIPVIVFSAAETLPNKTLLRERRQQLRSKAQHIQRAAYGG